jgi:hypothetical protein
MTPFGALLICMSVVSVIPITVAHTQAHSGSNGSGTLHQVVGDLLRKSNSPGGLEVISGCAAEASKVFTLSESVDQTLDALARSEKALTWSKGPGHLYRATIRYSSDVSLSSIHVPARHLQVSNPSFASDLLLQDPAVRSELDKLRLTEAPEDLGFSSIREHTRAIDLPAGTLGEDLMLLASNFGRAVWQLDQQTCGNTRTFRIVWIVK